MTAAGTGDGLPVYEVSVAVLPRAGFPVTLRPDAAQRARVAGACGVNRIDRLEADLTVARWRGDGVEIRGEIRAAVVQDCVITLEPVTQDICEPVDLTFLPEGSKLAKKAEKASEELVLDPDAPEMPETFSGETIDVWPVVVECLILAIDPFPRAPGATLDQRYAGAAEEGDADRQSPFAVLGKLKDGGRKGT